MEVGAEVTVNTPEHQSVRGRIIEIIENKAYVHFETQDRRLDKYFDISQLTALPPPIVVDEERQKKDQEKLEEEKEKIRNIDSVQVGKYVIDAWYYSPYPVDKSVRKLYICEYCMKYFTSLKDLRSHYAEIFERKPPGREIYRNGDISIFEVKGKKQKMFCQCLSLLGKLFIEHKNSYFDVDSFNYYVLCECDDYGAHLAAFYSVESRLVENNLSCIVVLPPYQKKGYGRLLVSLSYEISFRSGVILGPERPLSDMGRILYLSYWRDVVISTILKSPDESTDLNVISAKTWLKKDDIVEAIQSAGLMVRASRTAPLTIDLDLIQQVKAKYEDVDLKPHINPDLLLWFKKGSFN
ncbi:MOZ/SAS family protein [Trichomonas vaginalis G3]|uniref:Histone acetyltransferase n=1 Tax=Trichomonas vaginalis (strain ATCC PRA-98 / G3) TaxID=412133 RepID=A2DWG7_TRIV3|nr:histone acetyltransferase protein [Trichomonas vaginalis G3]EAY15307.1 MOZ/SAS family protein [Trichomonas vaginalis G3]KAI5536605.1 histone acetyltransferase protein [Trichomonas vaginalis G3]|eukprot:XP_001327530.1 MOZ/SAS family protein [Trichomonas vaginalis G3]